MTDATETRLAALEVDAWELEDGEEYHQRAPQTFLIPPLSERRSLRSGDLVKLMFRIALTQKDGEGTEEVERMWVIVKGTRGHLYEGVLDNDPYCTDDIKSGLQVFFEPRHVIQIDRDQRRPDA